MEVMWSFTSLDFEKFSKPTLVCRKPSTDLGIKRMVGLEEIKLDFFYIYKSELSGSYHSDLEVQKHEL